MVNSLLLFSLIAREPIAVRVDERIELLSIIFRLIDAGEFHMESAESAYSKRVDAWFAPYKDHPTLKRAAAIREEFGVGFDSVPTLAVYLSDAIKLKERVPLVPAPARWSTPWKPEVARAFVGDLKKFVKDTKFEKFLEQERPYYKKAIGSFEKLFAKYDVQTWLKDFYGTFPKRKPFAIVGLLCGGGNYGMSVAFPDGSMEFCPVFGADSFDQDGMPQYDETVMPTVMHEFSHAYVNPEVMKRYPDLIPSASAFMQQLRPVYAANAYGGETAVLNETFTRAAESALVKLHMPDLYDLHMSAQRSKGFLVTSDLTDLLVGRYANERAKYPTFDKFMPVLADSYKRLAQDTSAVYDRCPKVVAFKAEKGEITQGKQLVTYSVSFDQPMNPASRGFQFEGEVEVVKKTQYSAEGTALSLTIKYDPAKPPKVFLNRFGSGYLSAKGYPLLPFEPETKIG